MKGTDMEPKTIHLGLSPEAAEVVKTALTVFADTDECGATEREVELSRQVIGEIVSQQTEAPSERRPSADTKEPTTTDEPDAKAIADKMAKAGREAAEGETEEGDDGAP